MAGKRTRTPLSGSLRQAIQALSRALADLPTSGMLIGGIAVIARGVPRATRDVDATVDGSQLDLAGLLSTLAGHDIVPRIDDALDFATRHQVLLLRHEPSGVDVDISIAWLPFELEALAASEMLTLGDVRVPVARAEDLIIYKAVAWRPQDQQDIERLLTLHGRSIDLARIRRVIGEFAAALEEPERLKEFETLIERLDE
jgi:hypothetical protein